TYIHYEKLFFKYVFVCWAFCGLSSRTGACQQVNDNNDPYLWLEDITGEKSLEWVKAQNKVSENAFIATPLFKSLNEKFLDALNDSDKIVYPTLRNKYVYNFWKDKNHERGIWRRMPKDDYVAGKTEWETMIDFDELSARENKKWVYQGVTWLEPDYELCLVNLSDGGTDKGEIREYDAVKKEFVKNGFFVEASKSSASWFDRNTLLISPDQGSGTVTTSGYPRIVKKWKRNTPLKDATVNLRNRFGQPGHFPLDFLFR
ncbi:MAG: S9 family peptidase, partial [Bacteroidetes bacterium]|nr:S9 family peptidase [Bacteroidota bacterium]